MFVPRSEDGIVEALEGITRQTLAHGERTLMTEFHLQPAARCPGMRIRTSRPGIS